MPGAIKEVPIPPKVVVKKPTKNSTTSPQG